MRQEEYMMLSRRPGQGKADERWFADRTMLDMLDFIRWTRAAACLEMLQGLWQCLVARQAKARTSRGRFGIPSIQQSS